MKVLLRELNNNIEDKNYVLISGLGFDSRCLETIKAIASEKFVQIVGICNSSWASLSEENINEFKKLSNGKESIIGDSSESVIEVTDKLTKYLSSIESENVKFLVDVTALSHELLSILLGIMNSLAILEGATFLYVGASKYSSNANGNNSKIWLSRGVSRIRSVLGFPGMMLPSKRLHLIVFAGFETERASYVINAYEPAFLSIGKGRKNQSVNAEHHETNQYFFDSLSQFIKDQDLQNEQVQHFEFSCIDPCQTKQDLLDHIDSFPDKEHRNFVVCPLNTKLSTVGITLAAIERPEIQICYAEPLEYNTEGYAMAGEEVTIISLNSCSPKKAI